MGQAKLRKSGGGSKISICAIISEKINSFKYKNYRRLN